MGRGGQRWLRRAHLDDDGTYRLCTAQLALENILELLKQVSDQVELQVDAVRNRIDLGSVHLDGDGGGGCPRG